MFKTFFLRFYEVCIHVQCFNFFDKGDEVVFRQRCVDLSGFEDSVPKEHDKQSSGSYSVGSRGDSRKNDQDKKTSYLQLYSSLSR